MDKLWHGLKYSAPSVLQDIRLAARIRLALGAQPREVLRIVLEHDAKLALAGVAIAIVAGFGLTHLLASLLYGVSPTDLVTFVAVTGVLMFVTLAACYIPARRATKIDPMAVLKYQ